jgi:methionine synthase II (cobalamin-independent)
MFAERSDSRCATTRGRNAINTALKGIPAEKVRFHTCYAGSYTFEAANPRHEHEYHLFECVKVPEGKVLCPGVIMHASNIVEHPELIETAVEEFHHMSPPIMLSRVLLPQPLGRLGTAAHRARRRVKCRAASMR